MNRTGAICRVRWFFEDYKNENKNHLIDDHIDGSITDALQ